MKTLAITGIDFYQRHLSHRKGFTCAHLGVWGGISCSEAVKRIIQRRGVFRGWSEIRVRFRNCKAAATMLSQPFEKPEGVSDERWEELQKRSSCRSELTSCDGGKSGRGLEAMSCGVISCIGD